jgi:hypothetical protein
MSTTCGPQLTELLEHQSDGGSGLLVWVKGDPSVRRPNISDRNEPEGLSAAGLVPLPLEQSGPQHMKFGLRHHPAEAEQHSVVCVGRIVHAVGVSQQHLEDTAQIEQMVPVLARSGEPAHFPAEHDSDVPERDLGEQSLEAESALDRLTAHPLVVVDYYDTGLGPPVLDSPAAELVLEVGRLAVADNLLGRRLADVDDGETVEMTGANLVGEGNR